MKKIILLFLMLLILPSFGAFWDKWGKDRAVLYLTPYNPFENLGYDTKLESVNAFAIGKRIYFTIYAKNGFESDYIVYQVVKQDDNAHIGGYTKIKNATVRVNNKNFYCDYFVLHQKGKYYIQVFDLADTNHWLAIGEFVVVEE